MPDDESLARMYSRDYQGVLAEHAEGERDFDRVVQSLAARPGAAPGTFVDYGCGRGGLIQTVARAGWQAIGVEFDDAVAASLARELGAPVVGRDEAHRSLRGRADILHLGDVIEHLTDIDGQMPAILELLAPGGVLIAQGPLENNANLFTLTVRLTRSLRGHAPAAMPPYHVLLATANGQRRLFTRFGLAIREFDISEVAWPAPQRLGARDVPNVRMTAMFVLRRLSQFMSRCGRDWGNRYFCTAVWAEGSSAP